MCVNLSIGNLARTLASHPTDDPIFEERFSELVNEIKILVYFS